MSEAAAQRWPVDKILDQLQDYYLGDFELRGCWEEERADLADDLLAFQEVLGQRYSYDRVLGAGGSGVVLRLHDDIFPLQDSALKFPRPVKGRSQLLSEMLTKEIDFLGQLRHPGIVRILFHGRVDTPRQSGIPFYLMEAVDGVRSDKYVRQLASEAGVARPEAETASPFELRSVEMFRAVLDSIAYLHGHPAGAKVHLDIKPENILVTNAGQPVLIDLGTCKHVHGTSDKTIVACTLSMAPPSLARRLSNDPTDKNRAGGEIPRNEIVQTWDLYTFAASVLRWLGIDHTNGDQAPEAPAEALRPYARKYLLLLSARLIANEKLDDIPGWFENRIGLSKPLIRSMAVAKAAEGLELLDRLLGRSNPFDAIPEMAPRAVTTMQPSEGVHVPLTPRLIKVLNHRALRRLDSIAQLGMVVEVFPEARHTRKEHSLGTYAWTIQFLKALYTDPISPLFRQWITSDDCRDVLLAALLHDVGHFPLAHDLEDVDHDLFDHATLTSAWLKGAFRKKATTYLQMEKLDAVLGEWNTTADRIESVLVAKAGTTAQNVEPKAKLLRSIISGPIDADKVDYLIRDGDRMHLPYPRGIDVDRVLKSLTTVVLEKVASGARDVPMIAVHSKGKVAAEFVSIARYAMFSQGYWHHTVRSMKAMLARAVRSLVAEANDKVREILLERFLAFAFSLPDSIFASGTPQKLLFEAGSVARSAGLDALADVPQLAATDVAVLRWLERQLRESERPEAELIAGLLSRRLFKRLWVVSNDMQQSRWDKIVKAWSSLAREKKHRLSAELERRVAEKIGGAAKSITGFSAEDVRTAITQRQAQRRPWLLVDIPETRPGAEVGLYYVLEGQRRQLRKDEKVVGATQESEVWKTYAGSLLEAAGKIRVFCEPEFVDAIEVAIPWEGGIETLTESLEAVK